MEKKIDHKKQTIYKMKTTIRLVAFMAVIALTGTSCKKNWTCLHTYSSNPNDPNAPMVTSPKEITAKTKREAKLECKSYAEDGDTWELKADK